MTTDEADRKIREDRRAIDVALGAYNAVWQSWPAINAETVDECRRVAMAAALGAVTNGEHS